MPGKCACKCCACAAFVFLTLLLHPITELPYVYMAHKASHPGFEARVSPCRYIRASQTRGSASGSNGVIHFFAAQKLQDVEARDQKRYEKKVNDFERRLKKAQQELRAAKNSAVSPLALQPLGAIAD